MRTGRRCVNPECQVFEERTNRKGKDETNINPITGLCLDCTIAAAREFPKQQQPAAAFDPKTAQLPQGDR